MPIQMPLMSVDEDSIESGAGLRNDAGNATLNDARAFVSRATQIFWQRICSELTATPPDPPPLPEALNEQTLFFSADERAASNFAQQLPAQYSDKAAYQLTRKYAALLPQNLRGQYGIFYTPPALTSRLIDMVSAQGIDWQDCTVLDPACGGGAFLAPVALKKREVLAGKDSRQIIRRIGESITGLEIDPFAAWLSQVLTELALIKDVLCHAVCWRM